ncbi:hypothetical protein Pint_23095 [Pistacia integerrima]|uniref:Uncharacterized protein n=1 Tax=Pistacia integerrima TaxID=434235 RepID=A0ACC0YGN9_9ROSI|nr:hypothetical protein Pint_23095 [Pistacia integerrima]
MNTLSILSPLNTFSVFSFATSKTSSSFKFHILSQTVGSCIYKPLFSPNSLQFRASYKSPKSVFSAEPGLSDADGEEEEEEDYNDDDDDDEEEAADEYDDISCGISDEFQQSEDEFETSVDSTDASTRREEFKWQRVEKLCNEVKEYGDELIDVDELASVYDFRIDKFQRSAIEAFLRGSSVVVSAPTSSGKTLIAEAAAVATVARGRRILYTTPLKALSNQKFREFR